MAIALAIPKTPIVERKTQKARKILPRAVPIRGLVHNVGHASSIVAGILLGDVEMIGVGMDDVIVEPVRSKLIPGYNNVKESALKAGASGVAISGAGNTLIAIVNEFKVAASKVADSMEDAFKNEGIECEIVASKPSKGASVIEDEID
jgi:homoserine kinase